MVPETGVAGPQEQLDGERATLRLGSKICRPSLDLFAFVTVAY
jgi:hypothetical protein